MSYLHIQRPVAKIAAALYAFCAAVTELFIDRVFEIWLFNKPSFNSPCRTQLIFCSGAYCFDTLAQKSAAQVTIPAHLEGMRGFRGRRSKDTVCLALTACCAFIWIDLPDISFHRCFLSKKYWQSDKRGCNNYHSCSFHKVAPWLIFILIAFHSFQVKISRSRSCLNRSPFQDRKSSQKPVQPCFRRKLL